MNLILDALTNTLNLCPMPQELKLILTPLPNIDPSSSFFFLINSVLNNIKIKCPTYISRLISIFLVDGVAKKEIKSQSMFKRKPSSL